MKRFEKSKIDGTMYLSSLVEIYNRYRLGDLRFIEKKEEYKPVELICCEVLK